MGIIIGIVSFIAGGIFGFCVMCVLQINRAETDAEYRRESPKKGG